MLAIFLMQISQIAAQERKLGGRENLNSFQFFIPHVISRLFWMLLSQELRHLIFPDTTITGLNIGLLIGPSAVSFAS